MSISDELNVNIWFAAAHQPTNLQQYNNQNNYIRGFPRKQIIKNIILLLFP